MSTHQLSKVQGAVIALALVLFASLAEGKELSATLQYAGYAGTQSLGIGYHWSDRHAVHTHVGYSNTDEKKEIWQATLKYIYSPHNFRFAADTNWKWLYSGVLAAFTNNDLFFEEVADRYPTNNFYDPTSLRLGLLLGTQLDVSVEQDQNISVYLELVTLETQLIAFANNLGYFKGKDLFAAGLGVRYFW